MLLSQATDRQSSVNAFHFQNEVFNVFDLCAQRIAQIYGTCLGR